MKRYFIVVMHNSKGALSMYFETEQGYPNKKKMEATAETQFGCTDAIVANIIELSEQDYKDYTA